MPEPTPPSTMRGRYVEAVRDIAHSWRFKDGIYDEDIEDAADEMLAVREERVAELEADRDRLAGGVERVRALHQPLKRSWETICVHCSGYDGFRCRSLVTPWPCPTLTALDGTREAS